MDYASMTNNEPRQNEVNTFGEDKVARYNWKIQDEPGKFMLLDKSEIIIPEEYQRDHKAADPKILRIAAEWSWLAFGTLAVCRRAGGYYVADGAHRLMESMKRSDITKLPCMVYRLNSVEDEAKGFLRANKNRKPITTMQSFKALLVSKNADACLVEELCQLVDRKLAEGGGEHVFSAPGALLECIRQDRDAAQRAFIAAAEISVREALTKELLAGLFYIECKLAPKSVSQKDILDRLKRIGSSALLKSIANTKGYYGKGGTVYAAIGIQNAYNKNLRTSRIDVVDTSKL